MGKTPRKSGGTPRRTIPKGKGSTPRRSSSPKGDGLDPIALSAGDGARAQTAPEQDSWRRAGTAVKVGVALAGSAGLAPQVRGDPNKIKVGIRCRPLSSTEKDMEQQVITQFSGTSICLTNPSPGNGEPSEHIYAYDYLYDMESASESVFTDMALPLCEGLFEGFNGTIFAYGQTGSGKTHSMMGNAKDPGVIPRVAIDVFERANNLIAEIGGDRGGVVRVMASYIQIYREVIQDLLGDLNADLKIRRDPKFGTYVQGLSERKLDSADGLTHVIEQGNKKRAVAATLMNSSPRARTPSSSSGWRWSTRRTCWRGVARSGLAPRSTSSTSRGQSARARRERRARR